MADLFVPPFGTSNDITVAANGTFATFSLGAYQVYTGPSAAAPSPPIYTLRNDIVANSQQLKSGVLSTTAATAIRIVASGGQPVIYSVNSASASADATQVANVVLGRLGVQQSTASTLNATGTLTGGAIRGGKITSTTAAAVAATLDTGAIMETTGTWAIDDVCIWYVVNTGGNTFTVTAAASGHTLEGSGAVATVTSAGFQTRKTAAATFVTTRLD